uniref:Foie-gras_1 domain-containing protein n=1 Tax=Steinernema glaseri TaxID=37863 RepID=A0A1I8ATF2_9BILA
MQRRPNVLPPLALSWTGSETTFNKCDVNISSSFASSSLAWKKNGKNPLNVDVPIRFVKYSDDVIFRPQDRAQDYGKFAFLHLFFIDAATVDEYRANVRHEVSEWFAALNLVDFTQWLIVFDSTKSKENKTRGQVLERIKSDFSKYINRLIEIYDGSPASMSSLLASVQANVQTSIDCFATHQEAVLLTHRNRYRNPNWSLVDYLNQNFMILRFYERLDILEHVLEHLDDLSNLIDTWLNLNSSGGKRPFWLEALAADPFREKLYLLTSLTNTVRIPSELNIVELRELIVSRQIALALQIYDAKNQSQNPNEDDMPTYRADFAMLILRYTSVALDRISMDLKILEQKCKPERLQAWTMLFTTEAIEIATTLCGELGFLEFPQYLGNLLIARSSSIYKLKDSVGGDLLSLIGNTKSKMPEGDSSEVLDRLGEGLKDQERYLKLVEDDHAMTERLLKQFHWKRHARFISAQFSRLHWSSTHAEKTLPYLFKFISSVISDRKSIKTVEGLMATLVNNVDLSEKHGDKMIDYATLLMLHGSDQEDRVAHQKLLFKLLDDREGSSSITRVNDSLVTMEHLQSPIKIVRSTTESPYLSGIPGETVKIELDIDSFFPSPLSGTDVDIRLVFRPLSPSLLDELKASSGPVFECSFNRAERVNRFACLTKGSFLGRKHHEASSDLDTSGVFIFKQPAAEKILPGRNRIVLCGTAVDPGLYVVDRLELTLRKSLIYVVKWRNRNALPVRNGLPDILCAIQSKQPNVVLLGTEVLLSGMAQKINLEVFSGSTTTVIGGESSDVKLWVDEQSTLQFLNPSEDSWGHKLTVSMGQMDKETKRHVEVYLYLPIGDRSKGAPLVEQQVEVEWMSLRWTLTLKFEPLFTVTTKTSLLEESRMLELQLTRPHGIGNAFDVVLEDAAFDSAVLLNKSISSDVIVPNSMYSLLFRIPQNAPGSSIAKVTYRVENRSSTSADTQKRSYSLEETVSIGQEKAEYELCAQLCSEQPKAVLLRAGSPCNLVVSLRSLTHRVETVVIALESDDKYWQADQKYKLLFVKESGLGQTSFSIVPKMVGFLPYPGISVHSCTVQPTDTSQVIGEQNEFGARLSAFLRTSGRQVHVLGAFSSKLSSDSSGTSLELPKQSLRSTAKQRLQKLLA